MDRSNKTISISHNEISVRLLNAYKSTGINNFDKFIKLPEEDLLNIKNFGIKCLNEVRNIKRKYKLTNKCIQLTLNYESGQEKSKFIIKIPHELYNLPFKLILTLLNIKNEVYPIRFNRILNRFKYFRDLSNKTPNLLNQINGLGKGSVNIIINWFKGFHSGSYKELSQRYCNLSIDKIKCSVDLKAFLKSLLINNTNDIIRIDEIIKYDLTQKECLLLLELRTLYVHENDLTTKINVIKSNKFDMVSPINQFIHSNFNNEMTREILLYRWGKEDKIALEEIGRVYEITRERVRQICHKSIELFEKLYFPFKDEYIKHFLNIINIYQRPIYYNDICDSSKSSKYIKGFYLGFLSEVFFYVPFNGYLKDSWEDVRNIYHQCNEPFKYNFHKKLPNNDIYNKIKIYHAIFASDKFIFKNHNGILYLNRKYYTITTLINYFITKADKIVTIEEIFIFLRNCPYLKDKEKLDGKLISKNHRTSELFTLVNRIDGLVRYKRYSWGLQKFFSYSTNEIDKINEEIEVILNDIGHQVDAGVLLEKIKIKYPKIKSKYELTEMLKYSDNIINLGFLNYQLSEIGQQRRLTIRQIINNLFKEDWRPKNRDILYKEIGNKRSFRKEAMSVIFNQSDLIKLYKPNYFGLISRDQDNKDFLQKYLPYYEDAIYYNKKNSCLVSDIIKNNNYVTDSDEILIDIISKSKKVVLYEDTSLDELVIFHRRWGLVRKMICLLASTQKDYFYEEIKIICSNSLKINPSSFNRNIKYKFENDTRIIKNINGSYHFNSFINKGNDYLELLDEIELYLLINLKIMHVSTLYNIIKTEFDFDYIPSSESDLLSLLKVENRFKIMKGNMIGLL